MYFTSTLLMPLALASASLATPTSLRPVWMSPNDTHHPNPPSFSPSPSVPGGGHGGHPNSTSPHPNPNPSPKFCLTHAEARTIVDGFVDLLENTQENFNVTLATTLLADDFADYSDSINYLKRSPLGEVSFGSKQAFIEGQGAQPPFPSVETLNLFHTCGSIAWRWQGNYAPLAIRGINLFEVNDKRQIQTVFVEMNSGAFLKDVGSPECGSSIAYYN